MAVRRSGPRPGPIRAIVETQELVRSVRSGGRGLHFKNFRKGKDQIHVRSRAAVPHTRLTVRELRSAFFHLKEKGRGPSVDLLSSCAARSDAHTPIREAIVLFYARTEPVFPASRSSTGLSK